MKYIYQTKYHMSYKFRRILHKEFLDLEFGLA